MTILHLAAYTDPQEPAATDRGRAQARRREQEIRDHAEVSLRARALQDQLAVHRLDIIRKRVYEGFYGRTDVLDATLEGVVKDLQSTL
jgi:hypothetical protein